MIVLPIGVFLVLLVVVGVLTFGGSVTKWVKGSRAPGGRKGDVWKRMDE